MLSQEKEFVAWNILNEDQALRSVKGAIEELEEIPVEKKIKEDLRCTPTRMPSTEAFWDG